MYYRDFLNLKPKARRDMLTKFCKKNIEDYNRAKHFKIINRALNYGSNKKNTLVVVDKIDIYNGEINYINSLDIDYQFKKLMFTFLVQMKLNKYISELKNQKDYTSIYFKGGKSKYKNIKEMSNVSNKIDINEDFKNTLASDKYKLITILHTGLITLNFLDDCRQDGNIVIEVKDYENVGWYFDYYNNIDKVVLCQHCGQPFKQRRKDERFCNKHKEYQPIATKTVTCIDCGCEVEVDSKDTETCRCKNCREKHLKEIKKLQNQRYYKKNKV